MNIPVRYLPIGLNNKDSKKQIQMLKKSRSQYKKGKFYTRKPVPSFHNRSSKHIGHAQKIYNIDKIYPNKILARATGCEISALK